MISNNDQSFYQCILYERLKYACDIIKFKEMVEYVINGYNILAFCKNSNVT